MKKKFNLVIVLGTRPEIIKLSSLINLTKLNCNLEIIHTGQNFDKNLKNIFFKDLEINHKINYFNIKAESSSQFIARSISKLDNFLEKKKNIDGIIFLGDTNSCLSVIAAKKRNIPIFHLEAGNRCFEQRVPEETNRKLLDHISDINFVYSDIAREYLISENLDPRTIIKVGSPMREIFLKQKRKIDESKILKNLKLDKRNYIVFSSHREENVDTKETLDEIIKIIDSLSNSFNLPVIVTLHPRTKKQLKNTKIKNNKIIFHDPFSFSQYSNLCLNSSLVVSDSGTLTEEASILNFRAINLREEHERPEGSEEGSVIMSGINADNVLKIADYLLDKNNFEQSNLKIIKDYNATNFSEKVLRNILGSIRFVNKRLKKKI